MGLRAGAERLGPGPAHRGYQDPDPVPVEGRALTEGQGEALHDDRGAGLAEHGAVPRVEAARDALGDPVVLVGLEKREVAAQDLLRDLDHGRRGQARVDPEVAERAVQPLHVLAELEDPVAEGPGRVEHRVPVLEPPVTERDPNLGLGQVPPVEVRDPLPCRSRHRSPLLDRVGSWRETPPSR